MSIVPRVFKFSVSRAMSPTYRVELEGGALVCGYGESVPPSSVPLATVEGMDDELPLGEWTTSWERVESLSTPGQEQWTEFRERLDAMGAFEWQGYYENPAVLDGLSWSVEIAYSDADLASGGMNAFPDSEGAVTNSKNQGFRSLVRAIRQLTGEQRVEEIVFGS